MQPIESLRPKQKRSRMIFLGVLFLAHVFVGHMLWLQTRPPLMKISFLKVGQGDAILISSPSGNQMLVDGGPDRSVMAALGREMKWFDTSIEVVMNSHPDMDHIAGLPAVVEKYRVKYLIDPGLETYSAVQNRLYELVRSKQIVKLQGKRGQVIDLGAGVLIHVLFPDRDVSVWKKTNNASIFVKIIYGKSAFLLSGDAPSMMENYVVSLDGKALQSTLLKAGHHGSKTSTSPLFLKTVSPQAVAISYGKNNRYSHPNREVIGLITSLSVPFFTTETSTLSFCSDGERVWQC